jgi:TRL-like protein family
MEMEGNKMYNSKSSKMQIKIIKNTSLIRIISVILLFMFSSCTGINLRSWPYPLSPNTHPIESYSEGGVLLKGGVFYHTSSSVKYSGSAKLNKRGTACSYSFLYLVAFGSSRIYDAKVDGAVSWIGMIEAEVLAILGGAYHRHCTIVVGE